MAVVLMSGATGLIGSQVVRRWHSRAGDLRTVGREDIDLLAPGALATYVAQQAPDVFLHLAWTAGGTPGYRDADENASWAAVSREVAKRCRGLGVRFVGTGTVLDDHSPTDAYSRSKHDLRVALESAIASGEVTWLRPFYVFDPQGTRPGVLGAARSAVAQGRIPTLDSPAATHDFVHVDDVARAVVTAVEAGSAGVVEIGSGALHSVGDLVTRAGFDWHVSSRPTDATHDSRVADTAALRASGWTPRETERYFGDERQR